MKNEHLHKLHDLICTARNYMEDNMSEICTEIAEYDGEDNPESYENDMNNWKDTLEELENGLFEIIEND